MSYKNQIVRSSVIIGGSAFLNILIGLVRTKVVALVLGPVGVGLMGLLNNLIGAASNVAALGIGNVGVRQVANAAAQSDPKYLAAARRALFWGTLMLAVLGGIAFWIIKDLLAINVLKNAGFGRDVGWLAVGVGLNVVAGSQVALLNGMRRIADLAWISVLSALLASLLGIPVLIIWGDRGLVAYLLFSSAASVLVAYFYVANLPKINSGPTPLRMLIEQWSVLSHLGVAIMLTALTSSIAHLTVRSLIQTELGYAALGYFEAAWMISMTYVGFVLKAMGTDYYPTLTAIIHDHLAVRRLANEQAEVVLLLAGPVLLAMAGLAPWVIELLYSSQFEAAVAVLRWQVLGDVFKIASFPLAYIILAEGNGRKFMLVEMSVTAVFVVTVWVGLPFLGLKATGIAFLLMYMVHFFIVYFLAYKCIQFRWAAEVWRIFLLLLIATIVIVSISSINIIASGFIGVIFSIIFAVIALKRLSYLTQSEKNFFIITINKFSRMFGRVEK